ncbi:MAG: hypothetical protein R2764_03240 [Bacteroidales bacterium]
MKTTKTILVVILMLITTIGFSQVDGNEQKEPPPVQLSVKISLERAVQIPGLKMAIYDQVSPRILLKPVRVITVKVVYRNTIFSVYGEYNAWKAFFKVRPVAKKEER